MNAPPACPSEAALEQTPRTPEITRHLEDCAACRKRVAQIDANNDFLTSHRDRLEQLPAGATGLPTVPGYELRREIERGGQGVVYEAMQISTQRRVALKVLRHGRFATLADRARFEREVQVLAQLDHAGIVGILESGVTGDAYYLAMRFVEGVPLDAFSPFGQLPTVSIREARRQARTLLTLFSRICEAVQAAHLKGVIHRDLKPGNILVSADGQPCVLDFGLAKLADMTEGDVLRTRTGCFVGSLPWSSPEQASGSPEQLDTRSDVYSLGVILYQMLTGQFPYQIGGSLAEALQQITAASPNSLRSVVRALDDELDTIVRKALEKEPARRYQSVLALQQDIERYLAGEPLEARRDSTWYVLRKTAGRHRVKLAVAAGFLALVLGFAFDRSRYAARLEEALHHANIERGRLEGRRGNTTLAEQLLWREYNPARPDRATRWALRELYAGQPLLATWQVARANPVMNVLWSQPDDAILTVTERNLARWRIDADLRLHQIAEASLPPGGETVMLAVSPSGRSLALCNDNKLSVYDAESFALLAHWQHDTPPTRATWLDHTTIAMLTADERALACYDARRGAPLPEWRFDLPVTAFGANDPATHLAVLHAETATMQIYQLSDRTLVQSLPISALTDRAPYDMWAPRLFLSGSGRYVAAIYWDVVGVWDVHTGILQAVLKHSWRSNGLIFRGDDTLVTGGRPGATLWSVRDGRMLAGYQGTTVSISIEEGPRGRLLIGDESGVVRLWEAEPFLGRTLFGDASVHSCTTDHDGGRLALGGEHAPDGNTVWIRDSRTLGASAAARVASPGPKPSLSAIVSAVRFTPDNAYLLCGSYDAPELTVLDGEGTPVGTFAPGLRGTASIATARAAGLVLIGDNQVGTVIAWQPGAPNPADGHVVWRRENLGGRIPALSISPDGRLCAIGDALGQLSICRTSDGHIVWQTRTQRRSMRAVAFSNNGEIVASAGDDGLIQLWQADTGRALRTLAGHRSTIYALAFLHESDLLVSGGHDTLLRVWDPDSGRNLATFPTDGEVIAAMAPIPGGDRVLLGTFGGHGGVWDLGYYQQHVDGNRTFHLDR